MVLLADPTEQLYSLSDFDAHDVTYIAHLSGDPEDMVGDDCTCVRRFELSAEEGFDPPVAALRRDVCYRGVGGRCKFGNFVHCMHGGGFVLCDGRNTPFHIRCTDILTADLDGGGGAGGEGGEQGGECGLDIDEDWFCRPGCPAPAPQQIAAVEEVEENRGGRTPVENTQYWAKRAPRYKGVAWEEAKQKWKLTGCAGGKIKHLGYFEDEDEGARAYNLWAKENGTPLNVIGDGDKAI
jgi:hypothetical protein